MRPSVFLMFFVFFGCNSSKTMTNKAEVEFVPLYTPGPQALVYKTKNEYINLVPVLLSDDKLEIISYPHPKDLKAGGEYLLPSLLNEGYFLDNRGIGKNVAFLKYTYQEYSELQNLLTLAELHNYIIDNDPLTEFCDCGSKTAFTDIEKQLNGLIDIKSLRTVCKVIK